MLIQAGLSEVSSQMLVRIPEERAQSEGEPLHSVEAVQSDLHLQQDAQLSLCIGSDCW